MIERFLRWLHGYLHIYLCGDATERFLNLCNSNDILLWNICINAGRTECFIHLKDYKTLRPIARKCRILPKIKKRFGFPFVLQHLLRRKVLVTAVLLFIASIWLMSQYLWNISFDGEYRHTKEQLLIFLKEQGVYTGCATNTIDCSDLEAQIRKEYPDIGWVSVELKGTMLFVRLKETTQPKAAKEELGTTLQAAHIVAEKDGIISSMIVRNGTPKVKIGDVVKKGDILVSGIISVFGDDGAEISRHNVVADADITMTTYRKYSDKFPMKYQKKQYTGEKKHGYRLSFMDFKIFSYISGNSYEECDIISEVKQLRLTETFYLPVLFEMKTIREYKWVDSIYTELEAKELAERRLLNYMEDRKAEEITILSQEVTTKIKNGYCVTQGIIKTQEEAWNYAALSSEDLEIQKEQVQE